MSMGDENKDGKLKFKEWLTAGSIWDLAFGRAMIDCLTEVENTEMNQVKLKDTET